MQNSKRYLKCKYLALALSTLAIGSAAAQSPDGRGPVSVAGRRAEVTSGGVQLETASSGDRPQSGAAALWNPTWISSSSDAAVQEGTVQFRKEFVLDGTIPIANAVLIVSADPYYRLWVNGNLVSRGPDDPGSDYSPHERWSHQWLANRVDVAAYLKTGKNVIAAEVFPGHRGSYSLGKTALALRLIVNEGNPHRLVVETGKDWQVRRAQAYSRGVLGIGVPPATSANNTPPREGLRYDARQDDRAWRVGGTVGVRWMSASPVASVWGPIATSPLPPALEAVWPVESIVVTTGPSVKTVGAETAVTPIRLVNDERLRINYERVLSGYFSFRAVGPPGAHITFSTREAKTAKAGRNPFEVTLGDVETTFEEPVLDSFSAVDITVANATGPVTLTDLRATFVSQPVQYLGSFTSSDPSLNTLWKSARWQTQLCLQDRFLDSPDHLEPIGDGGDYLIESQVADYAFGPIPLTGQFLRQFAHVLDRWEAGHPTGAVNFHTSYSLLWLQMLLDDYDATGNETLARELAPSAYRLLDRYGDWIGPNGLLSEAPNYLFMDWVDFDGFTAHHPPAVIGQGYLTAFYYRGLADGLRLARLTGDTARVERYTRLRKSVLEAFNRELWDDKAGIYRDGKPFLNHNPTSGNMLPPDRNIETHSPHVNALAVLYDLAPHDRQADILRRALVPSPRATGLAGTEDNPLAILNVQPYFMHFVLSAEAHAGIFQEYAQKQLAQWKVSPDTKTFRESWTNGDWSHGWGGTPLIQLSAHVLGVSPLKPGFEEVMLAPTPLALSFAKGTVPTPHGEVTVSWNRSQQRFTYDVTLPEGTRGKLDLSGLQTGSPLLIDVDGSSAGTYRAPIALSPGRHSVVVTVAR